MRIIAGKFKGRRLFEPKSGAVRPTADKVRESVFDAIQFKIDGADFLDLYCGSGAVGIEAASRGANVVFCDREPSSVELTRKNLSLTGLRFEVLSRDAESAVSELGRRGAKFDYIFMDPPYADDAARVFEAIFKSGVLKDGGRIIYEHKKGSPTPARFFAVKEKIYGGTAVSFLEKKSTACAVTGSFDPITEGHLDIIGRAKEDFDRVVVVMLKNDARDYLFDTEERRAFCVKALEPLGVEFECGEGFAADFCAERGIGVIVRGVRDGKDMAYEREMARFNRDRAGIETLLLPARFPISASLARDRLKAGESTTGLIPRIIEQDVLKAYAAKASKTGDGEKTNEGDKI